MVGRDSRSSAHHHDSCLGTLRPDLGSTMIRPGFRPSVVGRTFWALVCFSTGVTVASVCTAAAPADSLSARTRVHLELDHANIAVDDLGLSAFAYQRMGFTQKPGRPHANSIANQHFKFLDDTELELITATEPRDALAAEYVAMARVGDGGAFVALRTNAFDSLAARLGRAGHPLPVSRSEGPRSLSFASRDPLRPVWFLETLRPWVERAEFTTHNNTALALQAVWLSSRLTAAAVALFAALGYPAHAADAPVPQTTVIALDAGELYLVPLVETPSGRPLIGMTIAVERLDSVESILAGAEVEAVRHTDARGPSLRVRPAFAQGIWLEFLASKRSGPRGPGQP